MQVIDRHRGTAMIVTVLVLLMLIGFVGLAVDWGYTYRTAQQLQTAADAAALAGAETLFANHASARSAAISLAAANNAAGKVVSLQDNPSNVSTGDIVLGTYDRPTRTFTPTSQPSANAVYIVARRTTGSIGGALPLLFGPIFGKSTAEVSRGAIAMSEGVPSYASIIALDPNAPQAFYLHGSPTLDVGTGSVQVDSNSSSAALIQGTSVAFIAGEADIVGQYQAKGKPGLPQMNEFQPTVADPLAQLPAPAVGTPMSPSSISGTRTFNPGYYPQGLNLNAGDNVTLTPGVYVLDNGFSINGHATLNAQGVIFYIKSGAISDNGTAEIDISPPTSGTYQGISFFQSRTDASTASFTGTALLTGTGSSDTKGAGTFYFPDALLQVGGTADLYVSNLIAKQVEVFGSGTKHVTDGSGGNQAGNKSFLVQ